MNDLSIVALFLGAVFVVVGTASLVAVKRTREGTNPRTGGALGALAIIVVLIIVADITGPRAAVGS